MACRLIGAKPLPEPILSYCQFDHQEQTSVKLESRYIFVIHENVFENDFCEMGAILSGGDELIQYLIRHNVVSSLACI